MFLRGANDVILPVSQIAFPPLKVVYFLDQKINYFNTYFVEFLLHQIKLRSRVLQIHVRVFHFLI